MITRTVLRAGLAITLVALVVVGAAVAVRNTFFRPKTITAYFTKTTAIYPGDDVRVSGIKVGTITAIHPEGTTAKMVMHVDHDVPIPADAKAVIVAQNLVAARYVQLTPAYRSSGPTMPDGAVIPVDRTAIPVEWDEVKDQLMRLATELGPNSKVSTPSVARFIDSAATALGGNGAKLRQTLAELSGVGRVLADGSGNIVDIIKNLQTFVKVLRDSNQQLVVFNNQLATLTSVLDDNKSDLDAALTDLAGAVGEVQRFIAQTRDPTSEQIARLADLTQILVDNKMALKNILHVTPNALANAYNDYEPDMGAIRGAFTINNTANSVNLYCSQLGAIENVTAVESGKLCGLYLSPALRVFNPLLLFNWNYLPIPINPILASSADPQNIVYTEPRLAPGGEGPKPGPPELPPAVSAYTGLPGDTPDYPPPPGPPARIPGAAMPEPPAPTRPGESPPPSPAPIPGLLPAEGTQP
ncbi:MCE family protein [Mycobacterium kansasii]|nr:MCE family protein [Mycobacterium kansasii]AGZ50541.1 mammalian cell entry protein [Mycobacterium kansasii ATCC 12478]ARG57651.1 mammalian cell entry protein [Mycobacterium kansasii]ARG63167.1 mammalian cell entry protein [Mycobacterium kansasii]ARG70753.1 mammalian cell entry protein [Mycobacterium kansasii]ARG74642.1 mammalian cell entry protein [Mycobacterium kansasii]